MRAATHQMNSLALRAGALNTEPVLRVSFAV